MDLRGPASHSNLAETSGFDHGHLLTNSNKQIIQYGESIYTGNKPIPLVEEVKHYLTETGAN